LTPVATVPPIPVNCLATPLSAAEPPIPVGIVFHRYLLAPHREVASLCRNGLRGCVATRTATTQRSLTLLVFRTTPSIRDKPSDLVKDLNLAILFAKVPVNFECLRRPPARSARLLTL
jgi:hypothetical protein